MHHARKWRLLNSGPLSQRIASGFSRSVRIISSARVTRGLAKLVSTSRVRHSRVHSSTTLSTRIARPLAIASCAKSTAHSWFAAVTAGRGEPPRTSRFRAFRRTASPAARYSRKTRLLFTPCQLPPPLRLVHIQALVLGLPRVDGVL